MALQVLSTSPIHGDNDLAIDIPIIIDFNQPIDPYTIEKGVSIYFIDEDGDYSFVQYTHILLGNRLTLTPDISLRADTKHYLSILPGNDPTRFVSSQTVSAPIYTRIATSTGAVNTVTSYTGLTNVTYTLTIGAANTVDVMKGLTFIDTFTYTGSIEFGDSELKLSITGTFDIGDEIVIDCFRAVGVDSIYKIGFDTSKYITITPGSIEITDDDIGRTLHNLYIVDTIPEDFSVDNIKCNPVVIKFNRPLMTDDDILEKITITKSDMKTSRTKKVQFTPVITGNILKLYLTGTAN